MREWAEEHNDEAKKGLKIRVCNQCFYKLETLVFSLSISSLLDMF
jgi:hypothetical protein